jgi:hypothetical protein
MITSTARHFDTNEVKDNRLVLEWRKTTLARGIFPLQISLALGSGRIEYVSHLLVLDVQDRLPIAHSDGLFTAQIYTRAGAKKGEHRFLLTTRWQHEFYWSHAPSTVAAKRIAARWLDKFNTFNDHYRIKEA